MRRILAIAERHGLKLVEDCALAVGTRYEGKHVGLFGDAACFSFYPVKHITTGDGGMFVSRHKTLAQRVAKARAFGVDRAFSERTIPGMYDVPVLGINYRLSDINSAIGRKQLERLHTILERRESNFRALRKGLADLPDVAILDVQSDANRSSWYCLSAVLDGELGSKRNEFVRRLNEVGIGTSVYYPHPVPRLGYYKSKYGYDAARFRQAARISDQSIALPVGPHLDGSDISYIIERFCAISRELSA
jgi:dTDP-4-amino-4,6-dideoxygalactose transaminase